MHCISNTVGENCIAMQNVELNLVMGKDWYEYVREVTFCYSTETSALHNQIKFCALHIILNKYNLHEKKI